MTERHGITLLYNYVYLLGDRHSDLLQDHVILPKHITDEFYATLAKCYEELFHVSLSLKSLKKPNSGASDDVKDRRYTEPIISDACDYVAPTKTELTKPLKRFSLDFSNLDDMLNNPFTDKSVVVRNKNEKKRSKSHIADKREKSNMGKILSGFSLRKKSSTIKSEDVA